MEQDLPFHLMLLQVVIIYRVPDDWKNLKYYNPLFVRHTLLFHSMVVHGGWLKKPLQVESLEENKCFQKHLKTKYLI